MSPFERNQKTLHQEPLDIKRLYSAPIWEELRVFLAVAKTRSFAAAGTVIGSSAGKISRQIKRLQDVVGAQLLVTTSAGIHLTQNGEWLAQQLVNIDEHFYQLTSSLRAERADEVGLVRVSATEAITAIFITPGLPSLKKAHPKIQLHLKNPVNFSQVKSNHTDIMLSFVPEQSSDTLCKLIGHVNLTTAASRSYLVNNGVPTINNLQDHQFIDTEYYRGNSPVWASWQNAVDQGSVAHWCDNSFAYALTVKCGLGVGLIGNYALANSDLLPVDIGVQIKLPMYVIALEDRLASRPVRIVYDWLIELFKQHSPWFSDASDVPTSAIMEVGKTIDRLIDGHTVR